MTHSDTWSKQGNKNPGSTEMGASELHPEQKGFNI